jgi:hypothetical protein
MWRTAILLLRSSTATTPAAAVFGFVRFFWAIAIHWSLVLSSGHYWGSILCLNFEE